MNQTRLSSLRWGEEIDLPSTRKGEMYSHVVGARYPCRSVAYVPRLILSELSLPSKSGIKILDPFMGSGTTALEANLQGFKSYGLEVDPYARLIGEASVQRFSTRELNELINLAGNFERLFKRTRSLKALIPEIPNIDYWFTEKSINDLTRLKRVILEFTDEHQSLRNFLLAAFGDIIRGVSLAERQSLKPYISSRFQKTPGDVLSLFGKCLTRYISGAQAVSRLTKYGPGKIYWVNGDATSFVLKSKIDVAITSPPYINAMDYVRCIRLESSWVGTGCDEIFSSVRASQLGESARVKRQSVSPVVTKIVKNDCDQIATIDPQRGRTVAAYFEDMRRNLECVYKSLKDGSCYYVIVGDSVVRGVFVETHRYISEIAEAVGFRWTGYFKYRIKDHRTSIPRNGRGGKIDYEHVIVLRKI